MENSYDLKTENLGHDAIGHCVQPDMQRSQPESLRDVIIRQPDVEIDLPRLINFFISLPAEIRNYLRYNVIETNTCKQRLEQIDQTSHWRLFAEHQGKIIADATMDREPFCWNRHVAQVRVVLAPEYMHRGVDRLLLMELVEIGAQSEIEILYTEVMEEQADLIRTLINIGFKKEARRKNFAKDLSGRLHDVIIMANDLEDVWRRLADLMMDLDTRGKNGF